MGLPTREPNTTEPIARPVSRSGLARLPVAPEGLPFLLPAWLFFLISLLWLNLLVSLSLLLVSGLLTLFFRDPQRTIPSHDRAILSPADGKVMLTERTAREQRVSIFLSLFDVHVNRSPIAGKVTDIEYRPGRFLPAFLPKAQRENERNTLEICGDRSTICMHQIAGALARRVVCRVKAGDQLAQGERIGLIRFGSRVDIVLPAEVQLQVKKGMKVKGGQTVLAEYSGFPN